MNKQPFTHPAAGGMAALAYSAAYGRCAEIWQGGGAAGGRRGCQEGMRVILGFAAGGWALPAIAGDGAISAGSLVQAVFGLGLVLLVMAGSAWLLRRYGMVQRTPAGTVKLIGGATVGQRERVVLVEVGNTWLVVGVAPGHVSALHSMPRGSHSAVEDIPANTSGAEPAFRSGDTDAAASLPEDQKSMNGPFSIWLNQLMEKCSGEFRK